MPRRLPMRVYALGASVLVAAATATGVTGTASAAPVTPSATVLNVQTYNVDLGANLTPLFDPTDTRPVMVKAAGIYADVQASLPAERMAAIARIIAAQPPEVVGLQEVATWQLAPWTLNADGYPVAAGPYTTTYDFLGMLLDDLAALGTPYTAVAQDVTFDSGTDVAYTKNGVRVPIAIPLSFTQAGRYIDRNVIIASDNLAHRSTFSNGQGQNYAVALPVTIAGLPVSVHRGWASVDVTTRGRTVRLYDTHLEAYGPPPVLQDYIRNFQAQQLAGVVLATAASAPPIVVGDINARPTMCATWRQPPVPQDANVVAYQILQNAGLSESWPLVHPAAPCDPASWTSGEDSLTGPNTLSHRIDDVFVSDAFTALQSSVVGNTDADRTVPDGLWPSDHASTVTKIRLDAAP